MSENIKYFYIREKQPHQFKFNKLSDLDDPQHPCYHRGMPVACVAYTRGQDPDLAVGNDLVRYALCVRSTKRDEETGLKDDFRKSDARFLSSTRLLDPKLDEKLGVNKTRMDDAYGFNVDSDTSNTEVVQFILDEIKDYEWVPQRVRNACQKWLDGES